MCSTDRPRYLVLRNAIAMSGTPCQTLKAATAAAEQAVQRTGECYVVVAIEAELSRDPQPRIIIRQFPQPHFKAPLKDL
ncbi:hypothetical protein V3390_00235 [Luteimonas sp. FXH3W]|uniref:Uncharacterized protein n=1 Tax=Aquilutibacter rugosus TaxID=3115820 RepID=A0ABU7UVQ6_9GAMM